jgi:hypothetical protein
MPRRALFVLVALVLLLPGAATRTQEASPAGSPPAGATVETLAAVEFPADTIPTGAVLAIGDHVTVDPGVNLNLADLDPKRGVVMTVVVSGRAGIIPTGAMRAIRVGGTAEDVPPGTEVLLGPGEAAAFLDGTAGHALRNAGDGPLELVDFGLYDTAEPATPPPAGGPPAGVSGEVLGHLSPSEWARAAVPAGPLRFSVRRVTLAPGAALPPAAAPWPVVRHVASGALTWAAAPTGGTPPPGIALHFGAGQDVPWMPMNDRLLTLSNEGDEPVIFWELAIEPAGEGAATPTG